MVTRSEMACRCGCGFDCLDYQLKFILEDLDSKFSIKINSGCRCEMHNKIVGGVANSYHVKGKAVDISDNMAIPDQLISDNMAIPDHLYAYLDCKYKGSLELILYDTFVHVGIQDREERHDYRKGK